jgi:hypothetical protein
MIKNPARDAMTMSETARMMAELQSDDSATLEYKRIGCSSCCIRRTSSIFPLFVAKYKILMFLFDSSAFTKAEA